MWLEAILGLSFLCVVQAGLYESSGLSGITPSVESILEELQHLQEEAEADLGRFRENRAVFSNRISGDRQPKHDVYPTDDIVSALSDILENVHEKAVTFIKQRITGLKRCATIGRRSRNGGSTKRKEMCEKLSEKYREECQEALIKRNSDIWEESKHLLESHNKNVDQKNADILRDIKKNLGEIGFTIIAAFAEKLQNFEDSYAISLPWQVKLDCLEEVSTVKRNISDEGNIFLKQIKDDVSKCQILSNTNRALFQCLWKTKEKVDQKLNQVSIAVNINFGPPFSKAQECVQNYVKDNGNEGQSTVVKKGSALPSDSVV